MYVFVTLVYNTNKFVPIANRLSLLGMLVLKIIISFDLAC